MTRAFPQTDKESNIFTQAKIEHSHRQTKNLVVPQADKKSSVPTGRQRILRSHRQTKNLTFLQTKQKMSIPTV
jgi:hypothetical protein